MLEILKAIRLRDKREYYFVLVLSLIWGTPILNFVVVLMGKVLHIPVEILQRVIVPFVFFILITWSYSFWVKKIRCVDYIVYFTLIIVYLLDFLVFPDNAKMLSSYLLVFIITYLYYFAGICLDISKLKRLFLSISFWNIVAMSLYYLVYTHRVGYSGSAASMENVTDHIGAESYEILPSILFVIWQTIDSFNIKNKSTWIYTAVSVLGFILLSSFGTRGPFVCLIIFMVLYVFFFLKSKYKWMISTFALFVSFIIISMLDNILILMRGLMESLGMSSRIFVYALEGTFTSGEQSADDRVFLLEALRHQLDIDPVGAWIGHGFVGWGPYIPGYPHNFYYDVVFCFGYVIGFLFIGWLLTILIKVSFSKSPNDCKCFLLIISMNGLVQLFMSGTFVNQPYFFLLIGYAISLLRNKNRFSMQRL